MYYVANRINIRRNTSSVWDNDREIWIDGDAGRSDSDSRMTSFDVSMSLKHQSTRKAIM